MIDPTVAPSVTPAQLDVLVRWRRDRASVPADELAELAEAGAVVGGSIAHPTLRLVLAVASAPVATLRVRRWRAGRREDLVGLVNRDGAAWLLDPQGPDVPVDVAYHPRWTSAARAVARFVDLGPIPPARDPVPPVAPWTDLIAATTDAPPDWLPPQPLGGPTRTLWDLSWTTTATARTRRLTILDLATDLVEASRQSAGAEQMTLRPIRSGDVWFALCHLLTAPPDDRSGTAS